MHNIKIIKEMHTTDTTLFTLRRKAKIEIDHAKCW